tara:strand:+ start:2574 stop:2906 length:333 start_codon:yes stop_codon:yes gene_type:complete
MTLEGKLQLSSRGELSVEVNDKKLNIDLSNEFYDDFGQYLLDKHPELNYEKKIYLDIEEELNVFCKISGYKISISENGLGEDKTTDIKELTNNYLNDDGSFNLDDPYEDA